MSFGENMQRLRREKGMSQEALAEKVAVTRQTVSKWELDQSTPDLEYIIQLSEIFGVTTDYLIKGTEPAPQPIPTEFKKHETQTGTAKRISFWFIIEIIMGTLSIVVFILMNFAALYNHVTSEVDGHIFTGLTALLFAYDGWFMFSIACIALLTAVTIHADKYVFKHWKADDKQMRFPCYLIAIGLLLLLINLIMTGFLFVPGITGVAFTLIAVGTIMPVAKAVLRRTQQ